MGSQVLNVLARLARPALVCSSTEMASTAVATALTQVGAADFENWPRNVVKFDSAWTGPLGAMLATTCATVTVTVTVTVTMWGGRQPVFAAEHSCERGTHQVRVLGTEPGGEGARVAATEHHPVPGVLKRFVVLHDELRSISKRLSSGESETQA